MMTMRTRRIEFGETESKYPIFVRRTAADVDDLNTVR